MVRAEAIACERTDLTDDNLDDFTDFLCEHFNLVGRSIDVRFFTMALIHLENNDNKTTVIDLEIDKDPRVTLYLN